MNPGRDWTGIPTTDWLVVVVVVLRTVVVVVGGGVGCRTTCSLVHDPKENAAPMKRTIRDRLAILPFVVKADRGWEFRITKFRVKPVHV
jgi:hypothetical protein